MYDVGLCLKFKIWDIWNKIYGVIGGVLCGVCKVLWVILCNVNERRKFLV